MVRKYIPKGFKQSGEFISQNAEKRDIKNLTPDLEYAISNMASNIAINLLSELRGSSWPGTPVDTGWARANWTISVGGFKSGVWGERPNPPRKNSFVGGDEQGSIAIASDYNLRKGSLWIVNNVPYIQVLTNGVPSQNRPPGMSIEECMDRAVLDLI